MALRRTPLQRKTPLSNRKPFTGHKSVPPRAPITDPGPAFDFEAAARAMRHQAESAAAPRRDHAPVPKPELVKKPSPRGFSPVVRQTIIDRDHMRCQRCGIAVDSGTRGYSLQHRSARQSGGTSDPRINLPANGIVLCGSATTYCHGWVEGHETEAARNGWAVAAWADPETVPVRTPSGWVRIDNKGNRWSTAEPTGADAHAVAQRQEPMK